MSSLASKVLADLRKPSRGQIVDLAAFRAAKEGATQEQEEADLADEFGDDLVDAPDEFRFWMNTFKSLAALGYALLGSRHLRKLAQRIEDSDERYMPGGPPRSPLTDSFHISWSVLDLSMGPKKESLATITIAIARALGMPREVLQAWKILADSYTGVYRIASRQDDMVTLAELVTGEERKVVLADSFSGKPGQLWWGRLLPPQLEEHRFCTTVGTPYVFEQPDAEKLWLDYIERQLGDAPANKRAEKYRRLMKRGASPDAWFEFILDAYAGVREHAVLLVGVPDLPETFPDSAESEAAVAPPLHRLRQRLWSEAERMGLQEAAMADFLDAREALTEMEESPIDDWYEPERVLFLGYLALECRDDRGRRALDELERQELDPEERAELEALEAGWFSVFEVLRVKVDEAIEVRDVVRRRRFWITERSATRGLSVGDCIGCWIMKSGEQTFIEGAVAHVPGIWSAMVIDSIRDIASSMRERFRSMHWRERQGHLVPWVGAMMREIMTSQPPIQLVNRDGDEILQSRAHYSIGDRDKLLAFLRAEDKLEETRPDAFAWTGSSGGWVGEFAIDGHDLCISAHSIERLATLRAWLENALGSEITYRATSLEDPLSSQQAASEATPPLALGELPTEVREQLAEMFKKQLTEHLDTKVPMLGNKTPRQAVRTQKGRDDVTSWLLGQECIAEADPQMRELMDTSFMWRELGLTHPDKRDAGPGRT